MKDITVVIATYNEEKTISSILDLLKKYSVVVVDDAHDWTADLAREYANTEVIKRTGKQGIASAYLEGFRHAVKDEPIYIVQMDAGFTHDPRCIPEMLDKAQHEHLGLVIGSRFIKNHGFKGYRTFISKGGARLMRYYFPQLTDSTSGFRCWNGHMLSKLIKYPYQSKGFAFQLENLYRTYEIGGRVGEIPIQYQLTNSSFQLGMVSEALQLYARFRVGLYTGV